MFAVTTTLPQPHEPIKSMTALLSHTKTPKSEEELKAIADTKALKDQQKKEAEDLIAAEDLASGK